MRNNLIAGFHIAILALLLLGLSGCGRKGDPFWPESKQSLLNEAPVAG
ncbi:MAG: lipoprotein [Campylobacterales bacterium]